MIDSRRWKGLIRASRLLIVTGPPDAGKTTVADRVTHRFEPSVIVRGDAFFGFLERGARAPWIPGSDRQGHGFADMHATRQMHRQFADATIERRHLLIDPPDDPDHVATLIVDALARGFLTYPSSPRVASARPVTAGDVGTPRPTRRP